MEWNFITTKGQIVVTEDFNFQCVPVSSIRVKEKMTGNVYNLSVNVSLRNINLSLTDQRKSLECSLVSSRKKGVSFTKTHTTKVMWVRMECYIPLPKRIVTIL